MTASRERTEGWIVRAGTRILKTRWLVRAPIALFRAGLGFLFGGRLLLLEHTGRSSGLTRYVVLEVIARPSPREFVIASGFGTKAQWYQNVLVHPGVRVRWSSRPAAAAIAHPLGRQEVGDILGGYAEAHPRAWASLSPVFESTLGAPLDGSAPALPMVRLELVDGQEGSGGSV